MLLGAAGGLAAYVGKELWVLRHVVKPLPWVLFGLALLASVPAAGAWWWYDARGLQGWERYQLALLATGWLVGAGVVGAALPLWWLAGVIRRRGAIR